MSAVKRWVGNLQLFNTRGGKGEGGTVVRNNWQFPQLIMNERPPDGLTILGVRCGK